MVLVLIVLTNVGLTIDDSADGGGGVILDVVRVEVPCAAREGDATVGLDAVAADFADGHRTATHIEVTAVLVLMVFRLTSRD